MKMEIRSGCFYLVMNNVIGQVLLCLTLTVITQAQTLSERPIAVISPAPPVVVPAKRVTVSQALRFGEQAEPRPDTLAKRSDLPIMTIRQPVMFDYDLLRWELGFDKGDGYHKFRIRVTNLVDTPQSFELLYAPIASRDGSAETSWRIVASRMINPGQTFTDLQSVLIENNITRLVFLMRRRDAPAKDRAVNAYSRNPEADYPIPAAVSLKADLTHDVPKIVASSRPLPSTPNSPLILPYSQSQPFKLERTVDLPVLSGDISFELEGLRWEIQNSNQCSASNSSKATALPTRRWPLLNIWGSPNVATTRCTLKILVTVTNLTNDKQSATLMYAIPERGSGTVGDSWEAASNFQEIYPGRSVTQERSLTPIYLTDTTQRTIPLRWLFRAYKRPNRDGIAMGNIDTRATANWKILIASQPNKESKQPKQSQWTIRDSPQNEAVNSVALSKRQAQVEETDLRRESVPIEKTESDKNEPAERIEYPSNMTAPPRIINQVKAKYTPEARQNREQGTVTLALTIRADGTIESNSIRVIKSLRFGLSEQAIEAVKKTKFEPARCNNQPCAMQTQVRFSFAIYQVSDEGKKNNQPTTNGADTLSPSRPVLKEKGKVQSAKPTRRRWP